MDQLQQTKIVLKSLIISSQKKLTIFNLNRDYLRREGRSIPFHSLGYSSLKQFLCNIPDTLTVNLNTELVSLVLQNSGVKSLHIQKLVSEQRTPRDRRSRNRRFERVTPRLRIENVSLRRNPNKNVINRNDDSLTENLMQLELHTREENARKKESPISDEKRKKQPNMNYNTLLQRDLKLIPANVKERQAFVTNGYTVRNNSCGEVTTGSDEETQDESIVVDAIPSLADDDPIHIIGTNLEVFGTSIPNAILSDIKSRRTYNIFISEVNRPWRFWFHLTDKDGLDLMEKNLRWYYEDTSSYKMNKLEMNVGNACVVFRENKWLRAEFIERPVDDRVKVCLVDYGTIDIVDVSKCRVLAKCFCSIPKHCYNGVLESIEPIKNRDKELHLIRNFCQMVEDKPLIGFVTKVDYENNEVRMVLIDTSKENEDVLINKELLDGLRHSE